MSLFVVDYVERKEHWIFQDAWKTPKIMWDLLHIHVSFWAYRMDLFKPYSLSVIQLSWLLICISKGWAYKIKRCYTCIGFFVPLYSPLCIVEVSLGFFYHGENFSSFSCFILS